MPYVPNWTEDTARQFSSKFQMLKVEAKKKAERLPNHDLKALADRAQVGDTKTLIIIEAILYYENDI